MLSFRNLTKVYPGGTRALRGVSLEIPPGMFGLVGPNGAVRPAESTQKRKSDGSGNETPITLDDVIEVGIVGSHERTL